MLPSVVGYWSRELFVVCHDPPWDPGLQHSLWASPPCRRIDDGRVTTFEYDAKRRYLGSNDGERCTYEDGMRASCTVRGEQWTVDRDDGGRIRGITIGDRRSEVRYDRKGRPIAIGEHAFAYDDDDGMVRAGRWTLTWTGYAVSHLTDGHHTVEVTRAPDYSLTALRISKPDAPPRVTTYHYDARDRLVEIRSTRAGVEHVTRYEYCD